MSLNRKSKPKILTPMVVAAGLLLLSVFIVEFFFKTWCGVQCIRTGYAITEARNTQEELLNMQKNLKIELAHLNSEEILMPIARDKFKLTIPETEQIIILP